MVSAQEGRQVSVRGSVTVRDMQPLLNRWRAQVIGGTNGLGRAVTWANTMRPRLPAFDGLQTGDLTVLSLSILRTFNAQVTPLTLPAIVDQLAELGVAGIAVVGLARSPDDAPFPDELARLVALDEARHRADSRALPLIALPSSAPPAEVERAVIAFVLDQRERQTASLDTLRATLRSEALDALLAGAYVGEAQMRARAAQLGYDLTQPHLVLWVELREPPETPARQPGRIGMTARRAAPADVSLRATQLAETLRLALAAWTLTRLPIADAPGVGSQAGANGAPNGWGTGTTREPLAPFATSVPAGAPVGAVSSRTLDAPHPTSITPLDPLDEGAPGTSERPALHDYSGEPTTQVIALLPLARGDQSNERSGERGSGGVGATGNVGDLVERIATLLTRTLGAATAPAAFWSAGLGEPANAPAQARRSANEARDAARLGAAIFGSGRVTRPADLGVYRLLLALRESGELVPFVQRTLAPLLADARNGDSLIETLEAFFASNGNLSEAARRLGLHRNSLLYRLSRARELLGHDLDDPELRLSLQLAIKSRRVLRLLNG